MKINFRSTLITLALVAAPLAANAQPTQTVFSFSGSGFSTQLLLNGTTTVAANARGWYDSFGVTNGAAADNNYIAGTCGPVACNGSGQIWRDWFRFDLSNFTPLATTAVLRLENPSVGFFNALGSSLVYNVFDVNSTTFASLGSANSLSAFTDIGTGTIFGTTNVTAAQNGTIIDITLNAAGLASINSGRQQGQWAVGGDIVSTTVVTPEPSTYVLMMAGLAGLAVAARRKQRAK